MKVKQRRTQEDRLLKRLSRVERKHQELLRKKILNDPIFQIA